MTDATIENNTSNKTYAFKGLTPMKNRQSQTLISIPIVNTTPGNTVLFRFSGQEEDFDFEFAIYDDGTDRANGTHSSTVTTVDEQIAYLKDHIFTEQFNDNWTFTQARYAPGGVGVLISDLEFDNPAGGVTIVTARMTLKRGFVANL